MTQRKRELFEEEQWKPDIYKLKPRKPRNRRKAARYSDLIRNAHATAEKHGIGLSTPHNVYKIRNKAGLFSTGGSTPKWSKVGKVWASRAALSSHFTLIEEWSAGYYAPDVDRVARTYDGCSIVVYLAHEILPVKRS